MLNNDKKEMIPCSVCGEMTMGEKFASVANGPDDIDLVPVCDKCYEKSDNLNIVEE